MKRRVAGLWGVVFGLWSSAAIARPRPQLDAFYGKGAPPARALSPASAKPLARDGHVQHLEPRLGVPTFFWADRAAGPSLRAAGLSVEQAARRHLYTHAELYKAAPTELAGAKLERSHNTGRGPVIASFRAEVDGVPVFRDSIKVLMNQDLQLVALTGYLSPHLGKGSQAERAFKLDVSTAVAAAYADLTGLVVAPQAVAPAKPLQGGYLAHDLSAPSPRAPALRIPARSRKVLFPLADRLEPGYYVEVNVRDPETSAEDYYSYVLSAIDGRILFRNNLTAEAAYSYKVFADNGGNYAPWDGPQGNDASPHPTGKPDGYSPPMLAPQQVTLQSLPQSLFSRANSDPWLPEGATDLSGNNAQAYADIDAEDGLSGGDVQAPPTSPGVFDYTVDLDAAPDESVNQRRAAITQLFYTVNWHHDFYYDYGYDETAGNSQLDNRGRGGEGGDPMLVEAHDASGRNNANMQTPEDGKQPRMQMYIFDASRTRKLTLTEPVSLAGDKPANVALFGPKSFSGPTGSLVLVDDGSTELPTGSGGTVNDGCNTPFKAGVAGKIAVMDRGGCAFAVKVANAQRNQATGAIILNNQLGLGKMAGADPTITIPSLLVTMEDGEKIKAAFARNASVEGSLFREAGTDRDGALDNAIVAHEWGHSISNRLIGNANGLINKMGRGLGEGWADFHALLMMTKASDASRPGNPKFSGAYATASFSVDGKTWDGKSNDGYYYGLRRQPYSTDLSKNGLTFKHIEDGAALPESSLDFGVNSEVHNSGEVWATMLWECYAALLSDSARLSFDEAQKRMVTYLVAAYKLTPIVPTLLEARDALLAAVAASDRFAGNLQDLQLFTKAFAKRGAGLFAVAPDRASETHEGVVEDGSVGSDLAYVGAKLDDTAHWCDNDGILDNEETGSLTITLRNVGSLELSQTTATVTSTTAGVEVISGPVTFPASKPFETTRAVAKVKLKGAPGPLALDFKIAFQDPGMTRASPSSPAAHEATFRTRGNFDIEEGGSATDDVESPETRWASTNGERYTGFNWVRAPGPLGVGHVWFGPNALLANDAYLVSPELNVAATGSFKFHFSHRFAFEAALINGEPAYFDGGVIEISTDNGASWTDIGEQATPGYNATLYVPDDPADGRNPLQGRPAFGGRSPNYDLKTLSRVDVDLGTAYAGKTVKVRFRIGSDANSGDEGWELDDLAFENLTHKPFGRVVADPGGACVNNPPRVEVRLAHQEVESGATVVLEGLATDPDPGDSVTSFQWKQTDEGPRVSLTGDTTATARFTAPPLDALTKLTFTFTASDGKGTSTPATAEVTVRAKVPSPDPDPGHNRAPIADAGSNRTARPGAYVQVNGSGSRDPDGDPLTYLWKQTSGKPVQLSSNTDSAPSFTAPDEASTLVFTLVVNDGKVDSAAASVTVTIEENDEPRPGCASTRGAPLAMLTFALLLWAARRVRFQLS